MPVGQVLPPLQSSAHTCIATAFTVAITHAGCALPPGEGPQSPGIMHCSEQKPRPGIGTTHAVRPKHIAAVSHGE